MWLRRSARYSAYVRRSIPICQSLTFVAQRLSVTGRQRRNDSRLFFLAFGGVALLLSAIGLYGVIACDITRRIPEIAVRLAIGAERRSLIRMVMTDSIRLVLIGVVLGLPLAYAGTQLAANTLHLPSDDAVVFLGTALVIVTVGAVAGWFPARRASRVDPVSVLRAQ
jgi:putative ABC transport system permease protein